MARFDIDTGGYPVQPRAKVAGCGFNLPDIGNPASQSPPDDKHPGTACNSPSPRAQSAAR